MPRVDDLAGLHVKARSEANCRFGPVAVGPLAKFVRGQWLGDHQHILRRPGGDHVEIDSLELKVNWRLKHEFGERWALGVEGYSEIEDLVHAGSFDDQSHRLGPVAYYEFPHAEGRPLAASCSVSATRFRISPTSSTLRLSSNLARSSSLCETSG
jgi:hypothetical protein